MLIVNWCIRKKRWCSSRATRLRVGETAIYSAAKLECAIGKVPHCPCVLIFK